MVRPDAAWLPPHVVGAVQQRLSLRNVIASEKNIEMPIAQTSAHNQKLMSSGIAINAGVTPAEAGRISAQPVPTCAANRRYRSARPAGSGGRQAKRAA